MKKLLVLFRLVALAVTAAQEDEQDTVKRYAKSRDPHPIVEGRVVCRRLVRRRGNRDGEGKARALLWALANCEPNSQRQSAAPGPAAPFYATSPALGRLFLYKSNRILQAGMMRPSLLVLAFLALATASFAQEQERKLVDRLLSPDTKLANPGQNKKFTGGLEAPTRSAATKSFYVSEKKLSKTFVADRSAPTTSFRTRNYSTQAATVPTLPPTQNYQTKKSRDVSPSGYSTKKYATRDFAGNRPFLGQGKSQKALHAQDRPLTIDEVRELLNKNK